MRYIFLIGFVYGCAVKSVDKPYWYYRNIKVENSIDSATVLSILKNIDHELIKDVHSMGHPNKFPNKFLKRITEGKLSKIVMVEVLDSIKGYSSGTHRLYTFRRDTYEWWLEDKREFYYNNHDMEYILYTDTEESREILELIQNTTINRATKNDSI